MQKVSVIIPAFNCEKYISEAIDSVLNQTCQNFEIIVIDDGSKDNTGVIVREYLNKYPNKIKDFHQENKGPAAARNLGIRNAKCEYIAFLDADDLWGKEKLEKSINFLEKNNFDWICTSWFKLHTENVVFYFGIPRFFIKGLLLNLIGAIFSSFNMEMLIRKWIVVCVSLGECYQARKIYKQRKME